jgi:CRISPR-associated protein (TIGR02710 family)
MTQSTESRTSLRALIMTIGLSRPGPNDLVLQLVEEARQVAPERVVLICSSDSRQTAERVESLLMEAVERDRVAGGAEGAGWEPVVTIMALDGAFAIDEVFHSFNRVVAELTAAGIGSDQIAINFTSGTKVMSAGAVLGAVFNECDSLRYLAATAEEGPSRLVKAVPRAVHAASELRLGVRFAEELRFTSAGEILAEIEPSMLSEARRAELPIALGLIRGYGAWENFQYERALECFVGVAGGDGSAEARLRDSLIGIDAPRLTFLRAIIDSMRDGRFSVELLVDLHNNAARRLREGKPNDAVARSYRMLEMLAQQKLRSLYDIDTESVDARKVPPRQRPLYEAMRSSDDGRIRVGLRKSYELLNTLDDPLGASYIKSDVLRGLLQHRYGSILAHGVRPLEREVAASFLREVTALTESEFPDFSARCAACEFPWLAV